jgi:hypothetical protein
MHALMHELEALNAPHLPGYLGVTKDGEKKSMFSNPFGRKAAAPAAVVLSVKDQIWSGLSQIEQITIFNNTFKEITKNLPVGEHPDIKQFLESNAKTKSVFETKIKVNPQPE